MSQVKITVSLRQARVLRRCLAGCAALPWGTDDRDALEHALARVDRAIAIHTPRAA